MLVGKKENKKTEQTFENTVDKSEHMFYTNDCRILGIDRAK